VADPEIYVMPIKELPRFKIYIPGWDPEHMLLHFGNDLFLPLFSAPDTARQFVSGSAREFLRSGQLEWPELHDFIKSFADIDGLDAILVDHDGTSRKQTVESFPFLNVVLALNRWKAAGNLDAPISGYSWPREIQAIGWPEASHIFDADDESEPEMPE
jgi:hypothetical protein